MWRRRRPSRSLPPKGGGAASRRAAPVVAAASCSGGDPLVAGPMVRVGVAALSPGPATLLAATWASGTTRSTQHSPLGLSHLAAHFLFNQHSPGPLPFLFFLPLVVLSLAFVVCCVPLPPPVFRLLHADGQSCCFWSLAADHFLTRSADTPFLDSPVSASLLSRPRVSRCQEGAAGRRGKEGARLAAAGRCWDWDWKHRCARVHG